MTRTRVCVCVCVCVRGGGGGAWNDCEREGETAELSCCQSRTALPCPFVSVL